MFSVGIGATPLTHHGAGDLGQWDAILGGFCKVPLIPQRNHTEYTNTRTLSRKSHH